MVTSTVWFATANGLSMEHLEAVTGVTGTELLDPGARHRYDVVSVIWRELRATRSDHPLPLVMPTVAPVFMLHTLWHGAHYAPDLRSAIQFLIAYRATLSDVLELELTEHPPAFLLSHPADVIEAAPAAVGIALSWRFIRDLLGIRDVLASVDLCGPPFGPPASYEEFFGVPVRFGVARSALNFTPGALDRAIPVADPTLFAYARHHLDGLRNRINPGDEDDPLFEVKVAIARLAADGDYTPEGLARRLGMSVRVLQRFVAEYDTTPSALIEEARGAAARKLLDDRRLSVEAISDRLGYSCARAFRRAFKRTTGETPSQYRRSD